MRLALAVAVAVPALFAGAPALAAGPRQLDPNWPCQQIKVGELSVGAYWTGPDIDMAAADWRQDPKLAALVGSITQRRMPIEDAQAAIAEYAKSAGADRGRMLPLLFAGVFDVLGTERARVLDGLDRFGQRQKVLADRVRQDAEDLRAAQAANPPVDARLAQLQQRLAWDSELFEDRRQSLRYACDVPTTIEQRLYALAQAIQQALG